MAAIKRQKLNNSIQFVHRNDDNKLVLNQSALDLISELDSPIAFCVCVGQYRSGKSFLLSQLGSVFCSEELNNFQVDHKQDNFTQGLWINSNIRKKTVENGDINLILVDSEVIDF